MDTASMAKLFDIDAKVLGMNTEGVSHEESLVEPRPAGNCLNWIAGHIVASRGEILKLVGEEPVWDAAAARPYERGAKPPLDPGSLQNLDRILADFARAQELIVAGLARLTPDDLAASAGEGPLGEMTVGMKIAFLQFHEAYHLGQIGLLRRIVGKEGAIA
jgi:hypothetical protein